jgi:GNAT superfamily N-acetyltransferase
MKQEIAKALKESISSHLEPHFATFYWHEIQFDGDRLEFIAQEEKDKPTTLMGIIKLKVAEEFKEIHISNIFLPMSMRRHGIGKGLIAKIYEVAKAHNYSLFLVLMTEIFFQPNGEARRCRHR